MGFYQPAQLVRDARQHGVEVREADVNFSQWDCTLEPTDGDRHAVRLGFRLVQGLHEEELKALTAARGNGFASIERLAAIAGVSRFTIERLAEADAFRSLGLDRRAALWAARRLDAIGARRTKPLRPLSGSDRPLPLLAPHMDDELFPEPAVDLPAMPLAEHVVEDYAATGLSLEGASGRLLPRAARGSRRHPQHRPSRSRPCPTTAGSRSPAWCSSASGPAPPRASSS